jgi:hypothetical protein
MDFGLWPKFLLMGRSCRHAWLFARSEIGKGGALLSKQLPMAAPRFGPLLGLCMMPNTRL